VKCVPAVYDLFAANSLFHPVTGTSNVPALQQEYLDNAVNNFAREYSGPPLEGFDLGEIETLAKVWNFDLKTVYTNFVRAMYELGKDRVVDELLTKASFLMDLHQFVEDGVDIACQRLNVFLSGSRLHSSEIREVMGLLDADLCEWIKQRSVAHRPPESLNLDVAIGNTHLFIMRLLSLSSSSDADSALRVRIHSLVVLSGILVKTLSQNT
jgi:hypothetical protein